MTSAVDAVAIVVLVERLTTQLAVNSERVVTTVGTVTAVTGSLIQLLVKVAFLRPATAVARYTHTHFVSLLDAAALFNKKT